MKLIAKKSQKLFFNHVNYLIIILQNLFKLELIIYER